MKLYLASTSPRRQELLSKLGIPFETRDPDFEETPTSFLPSEEVLFFAEEKARSVALRYPKAWVLGGDTLVVCEQKKMGKPAPSGTEDAFKMLRFLSGKTHHVYSALVLLNTQTGQIKKHLEIVPVTFRSLSDKEIQNYIKTGEPSDKAGAYAVQGLGRALIHEIFGPEDVVIGLPSAPLKAWFCEM